MNLIPPDELHAIDAERAVVGALLLGGEGEGLGKYLELRDNGEIAPLSRADFHDTRHQWIFGAIVLLIQQDSSIDPVVVSHTLRGFKSESGKTALALAGGPEYIAALTDIACAPVNIAAFCKLILDLSYRRQLHKTLGECQTFALTPNPDHGDPKILIANAASQLLALEEKINGIRAPRKTLAQTADRQIKTLAHAEQSRDFSALDGLPTHFPPLDDLLCGGLRPGELTIIAARPGVGKTALGVDIACNIAGRGNPVAFFSLEMSQEQIAVRCLARASKVNSVVITRGRLRDDYIINQNDLAALAAAYANFIEKMPLAVDDDGVSDLDKILASARAQNRRLRDKGGKLALIIIDYLQLIQLAPAAGRRRDLRAIELGEISRAIKMLAREMGIPIVAMAQLNRAVEQRMNARPQLSDIRDSGTIEQDADNVIVLWRENDSDRPEPVEEINIASNKIRQGYAGHAYKVRFHKAESRFAEIPQ